MNIILQKKRICDCYGAEIKKDFVKLYITWNIPDAVSGETDNEKPINTHYLEYYVNCFDELLEKFGLKKDMDN